MDALYTVPAGLRCVFQLGPKTFWKIGPLLFEDFLQFRRNEVADPLAVDNQPVGGRKKDQFCSVQGFGDFQGHKIRVDSKRSAFSIESQRRYHRNDLLLKKKLQKLGIDPLDFSRVLK